MEVINRPVESLIPYTLNNRTHPAEQVARIANSIAEFGFNQPIVIDEHNVVLVGHGRLMAAQRLGLAEVPTLKLENLSEAKKRAYRILDNKLQNDSEWELDNLKLELQMLEDDGFALEPWGLDSLVPEGDESLKVEEDEYELEQGDTYIQRGDLIELGPHRVLCGDSTSEDDVSVLMQGRTAQLVYTDPPYGVSYQSNWRTASERFDIIENDDVFLVDWVPLVTKISEGFVFVWTSWKVLARWLDITAPIGEVSNLIVWDKGGGGIGDLDRTFFSDYELAIVFHRGAHIRGKRISSVWSIGKDAASAYQHPTQKPVELAATAIRHTTDTGALVADLFLGSGSTLIACEQMRRVCYGMELEPKYCQVILERYKAYCEKEGKPFVCRINGEPFDGKARS